MEHGTELTCSAISIRAPNPDLSTTLSFFVSLFYSHDSRDLCAVCMHVK